MWAGGLRVRGPRRLELWWEPSPQPGGGLLGASSRTSRRRAEPGEPRPTRDCDSSLAAPGGSAWIPGLLRWSGDETRVFLRKPSGGRAAQPRPPGAQAGSGSDARPRPGGRRSRASLRGAQRRPGKPLRQLCRELSAKERRFLVGSLPDLPRPADRPSRSLASPRCVRLLILAHCRQVARSRQNFLFLSLTHTYTERPCLVCLDLSSGSVKRKFCKNWHFL